MGGVYTHIYESVDVSRLEIPQDGSFVKVGEIGHVFALFEFWRVHLSHGFRFANFFLKKEMHASQIKIVNRA